jgi:hypothetical protein
MNLRCKVFRSSDAGELEASINRFLDEELPRLGVVQFEEISQSESASGVTLVIWYSRADEAELALEHEIDEGLDEELDEANKELA